MLFLLIMCFTTIMYSVRIHWCRWVSEATISWVAGQNSRHLCALVSAWL